MGRCKVCLAMLFVSIVSFVLGVQVQAQFLPPPPVQKESDGNSSFTEKDRATLNGIYKMTRSIRAKLFPLEEEQQILRLER